MDLKGGRWRRCRIWFTRPIEKLPKEKGHHPIAQEPGEEGRLHRHRHRLRPRGRAYRADALSCCREVNKTAPVSRARYSAFTKPEITAAFSHLVDMDDNLASAGASRQDIDLIWGAALTRYLTLVKFAGYGNVRSSGRVQTPTLRSSWRASVSAWRSSPKITG